MNNAISNNKELLVTSVFIALCLALLAFFPTQGTFQGLTKSLFFLVIIPSLYIKLVLRRNLADFGFNLKNNKSGILWEIFMLLTSILVSVLLIIFTGFQSGYGLPEYLTSNFGMFLIYELLLVNFMLFTYCWFFQGFVLFYFSPQLRLGAVLLQALLFIILSSAAHNLSWDLVPFVIFTITGGISTYKSRSFLYSFIMGASFLLALNSFLIYSINR